MTVVLLGALSILQAAAVVGNNPLKAITNRLGRSSVQVEKFEPCPEYPDTPIWFTELVISHAGLNKFVLSGKIDIKETMDHPLKLVVEMYRCSSKDSAGSCEYYFTFKKDGICELLKNKEHTWDFFTNGTDLPSQCPFERLVVEMYRCSSKDSAGSCEYYFTFKKDGICELLKNNEHTWDFFTNGTDLPSQCPLIIIA